MRSSDRRLGLDRDITRRDFLHGIALAAGALGSGWSPLERAAQVAPSAMPEPYPPRRMGMRGSHPGSFEAAHRFRDHPQLDPASVRASGESYDLVVVGAGLSGLAAAHFFQKRLGERARVLILDNHDDFGGHAKRNELELDGRWVVLNGGTLEIESPSRYNEWAARLLTEIGIDLDRYRRANAANATLYSSRGLRPAYFFDRETFGVDRLVVAPANGSTEGAVASPQLSAEWVRRMPISETAKRDLLRLQDPNQPDYLPGLSSAQKKARLARMSYEDYLLNVAKVDRQAAWFYSALGRDVFGVGSDATPALFAWQMQDGAGGFAGLKLEPSPEGLLEDLPGGQHGRQKESDETVHFPDGNATLARLLVRRLIPEAVPGSTQEDVGAAQVAYEHLDRAEQPTRIRLESTVLNVCHDGARQNAREVVVSYARDGALESVRGRACVLACWHMFIPYLVPDLPAAQKEALAHNVKAPIVYSNVFLRLACVRQARRESHRLSDDVSRYDRARGSRRPRRAAPCALPRRADRAAPDAHAGGAGTAAQGAAPPRAGRAARDLVRDLRATHPRAAPARARPGRLRSGTRHRGDRRQSLAARILLYVQQPLRSARVGLHRVERATLRDGAPALRSHLDRKRRCRREPAHRCRDR